jgi:large subunit ribosomal protein L30
MTKLKITWKKSAIGYNRNQREVVRALGLRRLHQTVIRQDTPTIRGMLQKVSHLVEVVEE